MAYTITHHGWPQTGYLVHCSGTDERCGQLEQLYWSTEHMATVQAENHMERVH